MGILIAVPGVAVPAAAAMNSGLNVMFTYRLGTECLRRFSEPNVTDADLVDFGRSLVRMPSRAEIAAP